MYFKPFDSKHTYTITNKLQEKFKQFENEQIPAEHCVVSYDELKSTIPELAEVFKQANVEVISCFLFQSLPGVGLAKHIDCDKDVSPNVIINWPIFNCEHTKMNFYRETAPIKMHRLTHHPVYNNPYVPVSSQVCELDDCLELITPHLIDVSKIHEITNVSKHRLIMSFRFKDSPLHLWQAH